MKLLLFLLLTIIAGCYEHKEEMKTIPVTTSLDFDKAKSFFQVQNDSSYYYFNKVTESGVDSLQIAIAYNYMAVIQREAGDFFGSQERLLESLGYLNEVNKNDHYCLSSDYTILGNNCLDLKNYDAAIEYYDRGLIFAVDETLEMHALNGKAVAYQKMQDYPKAITIYDSLINRIPENKREYARILSNLARTKWLLHPDYQPLPEFFAALKIRREIKDDWGLNASYSHLADYYAHSRPDSALVYAHKMYAVAQQLNSPDDQLEALQKLIELSRPEDLRQYATRYQYLNDSVQTVRNTAKNQFALIKYEAAKSKSENLVLQKDNAEKNVQIIQQRVWLYGTVFVLIAGAFISLIWYRKRKQKMLAASRNAIREHQLKTSQKVHDVVANGLYRIITELEHNDIIDKEQLLNKIDELYEQSRDLSYEQPAGVFGNFTEEINRLLMSFATPATKILIAGNENNFWNSIKAGIKKELLHVLLELMINMKKHSHAKNVVMKFEQQDNEMQIRYKDDGVGLPPDFQPGNGLTNTGNRIKEMGGRIIFDRSTATGLMIRISFPIT